MKTVKIKGKDYVEVNERIKYFRSQPKYEGFSLETEIISLEDGVVTMKAIVRDVNGVIKATGFAQEKESSSFINKTSFIENCETSAWGRALGNLGIGIDTSIASCEEVLNAIKNQRPKETPVVTNDDVSVYARVATCETVEELEQLWRDEHKNVFNEEAFKEMCSLRKTALIGA